MLQYSRVVELQEFGMLRTLCFWMSLITFVVLYFAVLRPPLKTFTLQTLQTADKLVGVASGKYLHTADSSARSMLLLSLSVHWLDMSCTPHSAMLQAKNFHGSHTPVSIDIGYRQIHKAQASVSASGLKKSVRCIPIHNPPH